MKHSIKLKPKTLAQANHFLSLAQKGLSFESIALINNRSRERVRQLLLALGYTYKDFQKDRGRTTKQSIGLRCPNCGEIWKVKDKPSKNL